MINPRLSHIKTIKLAKGAIERARKAEKRAQRAIMAAWRTLKTLKAERKTRKALDGSQHPSDGPEDPDEVYQTAAKKYLKTKTRLDLAAKGNPHLTQENKRELERVRRKMAEEQLQWWKWHGDEVPFAQWQERQTECEAWEAQAARVEEAMYWRTLALAAQCFLEAMPCAGADLVSSAEWILEGWYDIAFDSDGISDRD